MHDSCAVWGAVKVHGNYPRGLGARVIIPPGVRVKISLFFYLSLVWVLRVLHGTLGCSMGLKGVCSSVVKVGGSGLGVRTYMLVHLCVCPSVCGCVFMCEFLVGCVYVTVFLVWCACSSRFAVCKFIWSDNRNMFEVLYW